MSFGNKIRGIKEIWQFENHWYLFLVRIFFPQQNVHIYKYKGLSILTDHSAGDANGAREILTSDMYRIFLSELKLPDKVNILDLGANNGSFPLLLKSENFVINKAVCVELNPNTFSRLSFNLANNFEAQCVALNLAVCGTTRDISIKLGTGGASDNIYKATDRKNTKAYQIKGRTFNEIYDENFENEIIDICKMDVEGAEFEIFENENCSKISNCRYLLIEIHHEPERERRPLIDKLKILNFEEISGENKFDYHHYVHLFRNKNLT